MEKKYPKVLVISHNMFGLSNNMGRTLNGMFKGWDKDKIAQFCFQSEKNVGDCCDNFYRITDTDVLKSIIKRKNCGKRITVGSERIIESGTGRGDRKLLFKLYDFSRKRVPIVYLSRMLLWKIGKWHTKDLNDWIDDFNPEIVFLASGDYSFAYDVAYKIASERHIPLIVYACDDHYLCEPRHKTLLAKLNRRHFMKSVNRAIGYSSHLLTICEKMRDDYATFFNKVTSALYTSSSFEKEDGVEKENRISYIGNLYLGRYEQIIKIGQALKMLDCPNKPEYIDVYSHVIEDSIISKLTKESGINFHGEIAPQFVKQEIQKSMAVIHVESMAFDKSPVNVKYSVSTKIADSLASGTCLLAMGPADIASIEYLKDNEAAFVVTDCEQLEGTLRELITNSELRQKYSENAVKLAEKNHNAEKNVEFLRNLAQTIVENRS